MRGAVEHATIPRRVLHDTPPLDTALHRHKRTGGGPAGGWTRRTARSRARGGHSIGRCIRAARRRDVRLSTQRDEWAAMCVLPKAIRRQVVPERTTSDGVEAKAPAIRRDNAEHGTAIIIRQVKSRHNIIAQDHRAVNGGTCARLGGKAVEAAQRTGRHRAHAQAGARPVRQRGRGNNRHDTLADHLRHNQKNPSSAPSWSKSRCICRSWLSTTPYPQNTKGRTTLTRRYTVCARWFPFVDTFRTLCLAPPPSIKDSFAHLKELTSAS